MALIFNPISNTLDEVLPIKSNSFGSTPNGNGFSSDAQNNLTLQPADATHPGGVSTTTQSIAGNKTFTGSIAINGAVTLSALQASTALVSDGSNDIISSATTATEIGYVHGVTSALQTQLNATEKTANKGAANGYCPLDASSKVPASNLPSTVFEYQGAWNPSTNTPALSDLSGVSGYVYRVSTTFAGPVVGLSDSSMVNFQVGNLIIYSGTVWQQTSAVDGVVSVNGAQGAVTVNAINQLTGDITAGPASQSQSKAATVAAIQGTTVSGTTGSGNVVFSSSPTLVTPALGTPASGVATNLTGLPLTTGVTGTLAVTHGGTGTSTAFTQNSIIFAGASGNYTQNAASLSYDPSLGEHGRMAINLQDQVGVSASPTNAVLNVYCASGDQGIAITSGSSNDPLLVQNSGLAPTATLITASGSSSTTPASLIGAQCRGTLVSKTQTQAGDTLFSITGQGYSGTDFGPGVSGAVGFVATENATSSASGGTVIIASTPNGTQTPIPGIILGQDQKVQLPVYTTAGVLTNDTSGNVLSTSVLPISKGGTGSSTQNFVDLTTNQSAAGNKTLTGLTTLTVSSSSNALTINQSGSGFGLQVATGKVLVGANTGSLTSTPANLSLGGSTGNSTPGSSANLKLSLYNAGGGTPNQYGMGISATLMEFQAGQNNDGNFAWYTGNSTQRMKLATNGTLTLPSLTGAGVVLNNASGDLSTTNGALPIANGGTAVTSVTTTPTATSFAGWDANSNLSANNLIEGFTTTAMAGGTTTMTIASSSLQYWTGSSTTAQTIKLPTTSIVAGMQYTIVNTTGGTGSLSVQSSGANAILTIAPGFQGVFTALVATPTTAANWSYTYSTANSSSTSLTNPMTTGGDIIYGGTSGTPTRLANGSSGQVLTSSGGTSAPVYQTLPGSYYYSGYYPASGTNEWTTTNTSPWGNFTVVGTIPTITPLQSSGITVTNATSNFPGVHISSAPRTGTLKLTFKVQIIPGLNAAATSATIQLLETTTSTQLDSMVAQITANNVSQQTMNLTLSGYFSTTSGTPYNFILQGAVGSGTMYIGGYTITGSMLSVGMEYIN